MDEGIDLEHTDKKETEVVKHLSEEIPEQSNIRSEIRHHQTMRIERKMFGILINFGKCCFGNELFFSQVCMRSRLTNIIDFIKKSLFDHKFQNYILKITTAQV